MQQNLYFADVKFSADGTIFSENFGDIYHSSGGAILQAKHVFINGNDLENRWNSANCQQFTILETGFGLANNFLTTCDVFYDCDVKNKPKVLNFISFELYVLPLNIFKNLVQKQCYKYNFFAEKLFQNYPPLTSGIHKLEFYFEQQNQKYQINLYLVLGEITTFLPKIDIPLGVDAIYLDGFSPSKNPQIWSEKIMFGLKRISKKNTTIATWCVAGEVRKNLIAAEFEVQKVRGFAQKKQMLIGKFKSQRPPKLAFDSKNQPKIAIVVGAGLAGCFTAFHLAKFGWEVHLLDSNAEICQEASGNLAGLLHPMPSSDDNFLSQLSKMGYFSVLNLLEKLNENSNNLSNLKYKKSGILHLANTKELFLRQQKIIENSIFPPEHLQLLNATEIENLCKISLKNKDFGGLYFPHAAYINPKSLCQTLLNIYKKQIIFHPNFAVEKIHYAEKNQQFLVENFDIFASVLVLCTGAKNLISENFALPIKAARGQVSVLNNNLHNIKIAKSSIPLISKSGYIIPNIKDEITLIGATFEVDNLNKNVVFADNLINIQNIQQFLDDFYPQNISETSVKARANLRAISPDRLPICGQMIDFSKLSLLKNKCKTPKLNALPRINGLFCLNALAARGLIYSNLLAEFIALQVENLPSNLPTSLSQAIDVGRFYL